jgi:hypothetical protein
MKGAPQMTNTWTMTKVLIRQRIQTVVNTLVVTIVATIITAILMYFGGSARFSIELFYYAFQPYLIIGGLYLFIRLAIRQEHTWVDNYYRSVPITNLKLYLANLFSTICNFVIYCLAQSLIFTILQVASHGIHWPETSVWMDVAEGVIILGLTCLFIWTFVSLVHLLSVTIMAFLPETQIRLAQWAIYLVVIITASYLFNQLWQLFLMPFSNYNITAILGVFLVIFALISSLNVYLLDKWVETK